MISRRDFLKIAGLSVAAVGGGYKLGSMFASGSGDTKKVTMAAFLPDSKEEVTKALSVFREFSGIGNSAVTISATGNSELKEVGKNIFNTGSPSNGKNLRISVDRLSENVEADILISDGSLSLYNPDLNFNAALTGLRRSLKNKNAGLMVTVTVSDESLFSSYFGGTKTAVVEANGKIVEKISLERKSSDITVAGSHGNALITVGNGIAYIKHSDCRNKLCSKMGHAHMTNDVVACAPNKVVLRIENA